jgi:hypothetical protein
MYTPTLLHTLIGILQLYDGSQKTPSDFNAEVSTFQGAERSAVLPTLADANVTVPHDGDATKYELFHPVQEQISRHIDDISEKQGEGLDIGELFDLLNAIGKEKRTAPSFTTNPRGKSRHVV